jgi:hypothetical protein
MALRRSTVRSRHAPPKKAPETNRFRGLCVSGVGAAGCFAKALLKNFLRNPWQKHVPAIANFGRALYRPTLNPAAQRLRRHAGLLCRFGQEDELRLLPRLLVGRMLGECSRSSGTRRFPIARPPGRELNKSPVLSDPSISFRRVCSSAVVHEEVQNARQQACSLGGIAAMTIAPGLWPRDEARPSESVAETTLYGALRAGLPAGWHAWHSLRIRSRDGYLGEGDFVFANPDRGLLVLEVKGGRIEERDGRWLQNSKPLAKAPLEQGLDFVHRLVRRLDEEGHRPPAFGAAVCFPDCLFEKAPGQDDLARVVIGSRELGWLREALPALMERALPTASSARTSWIDAIHRMWGETWIPQVSLGYRARDEKQASLRLGTTQLAVLDGLLENERMLVSGPAGSGKTLISAEAARRYVALGKRVLFLCFTRTLATWLRAQLSPIGVQVQTVSAHALALVEKARGAVQPDGSQRFWRELNLEAADLAPKDAFDVVIIDEAQDLTEEDWLFIEAVSRGGRLWAFQDEAQRFWQERTVSEELFGARFRLPRSRRSPSAVQALANRCIGAKHDSQALSDGLKQGALGIVRCANASAVPDKIGAEVDRLLSEGLAPSDIAIVSLRGREAASSIHRLEKVGRHMLTHTDAPDMAERLVADSFLHWKGLERPAVIVTDIPDADVSKLGVRLYIALTRSLLVARIIAPRDRIDAHPMFEGL